MVLERVEITIAEERRQEFESSFQQALGILQSARGCESASIKRGVENPNHYLLLVKWASLDSHTAFTHTSSFNDFRNLISHFYSEKPRMEHFINIFDNKPEKDMSIEDKNKELVTSFFTVFSAGEQEKVLEMLSDSATWWIAGSMPISRTYDKSAFAELLSGVSDAMQGNIRIVPRAFTAEGNRVAVEAESFATTLEGVTYNNLYHFLIVIDDNNKISEVKEYLDTTHAESVLCKA